MLHNRFAVIKLWDTVCAEDENIQRIIDSAAALGIECVPVDKNYCYLSDPNKVADENDFDFVLHLHFESLKINNLFSFVTLWNPTQFYHDWGYRRYTEHLCTHDDFLTSCAVGAEDQLRRVLCNASSHLPPMFRLFPSSSEHIFPPEIRKNRRVHYCGINWDKLSKKKSRHSDLLLLLNKHGVLDIYGPKELNGVPLWNEFSCYRGSVSFDGHSMIKTIQQSGISLVISSPAHIESQLMSNRLFEGLAAGANLICDENTFAKKFMKDTVLYVSSHDKSEVFAQKVYNHVTWLNEHPQEAYEMAKAAQEIFKKEFDLKLHLKNIYDNLEQRKAQLKELRTCKQQHSVHVCAVCFDKNLTTHNIIHSIENNDLENITYHIYCYDKQYEEFNNLNTINATIIVEELSSALLIDNDAIHAGRILTHFLDQLDADDIFMVLMQNEVFLTEHISSLLRKMEMGTYDCVHSRYLEITRVQNKSKKKNVAGWTYDRIPRAIHEIDGSLLAIGAFMFVKSKYISTYTFTLPYIQSFLIGYLLISAQKLGDTKLYSYHLYIDKSFVHKNNNDLNILLDISPESSPILNDIVSLPVAHLHTPLVIRFIYNYKEVLKKLPLYNFAKSIYINYLKKDMKYIKVRQSIR